MNKCRKMDIKSGTKDEGAKEIKKQRPNESNKGRTHERKKRKK